jgi:cytochrome b561
MLIKNTSEHYGLISKMLHWGLVLLVFTQFFLVYWKRTMLPEDSETAKFFIGGLHKPLGMVILLVALIAILWRWINVKPKFPAHMQPLEKTTANLAHGLLYLFLIIMPLSGLLMSVAAGYPPSFFGLFTVPMFLEKNKQVAEFFFTIHALTSYAIIVLVSIHTLAALKHHFVDRDEVLKRML